MANLTAFDQFDINNLNLNFYAQNLVNATLEKNGNFTLNGIAYPDYYYVAAGGVELDILGSGITLDAQKNVIGGTVNVIGELEASTLDTLWYAQGLSLSAAAVYNAALTPSNTDDLTLVENAFAGNDTIILSSQNDRMSGYAGNDLVAGAGGNDILDGGDGTDTAFYLADIENATITFDGNVLVVTAPNEGTDRLSNFEFVNFNGNVRLLGTLTDLVKPTLTGFSPADGATNVALAANLTLTFSETIRKGTGTIALHAGSATGPVVEQFDAATSSRITVIGSTITVDPTNPLAQGTKYFLTLDKGTVTDVSGNRFDGASTYDFTTFGVAPATAQSRYFAPNNYALKLSGFGQVFGTSGLQDISILDFAGAITFDPSFNRGGDVIRLVGNAAQWQIARLGSSAILSDGDTAITVPLGTTGVPIVFADGTRLLKFDNSLGVTTIGNQVFSEQPAAVTAIMQDIFLPAGTDPNTFGRLYLADGSQEIVDGKLDVFGSNGPNGLGLLGGEVRLDPSFNRGGDLLAFRATAQTVTAVRNGSSIVLDGAGLDATIPVGTTGMTVSFIGPDPRELIFDTLTSTIHLGNQIIGTTPVSLTAFA